jgi:hypothetical protein
LCEHQIYFTPQRQLFPYFNDTYSPESLDKLERCVGGLPGARALCALFLQVVVKCARIPVSLKQRRNILVVRNLVPGASGVWSEYSNDMFANFWNKKAFFSSFLKFIVCLDQQL